MSAPDGGLLLVDKPKGLTSHDVVLALRRRLAPGVKVGHSGTLDPMASGLLILLVGRATKSAAHYQHLPKVYTGTIRFGQETDTGDLDGRLQRSAPLPEGLDAGRLKATMEGYRGTVEMPAPLYSAVKYKGKPLYAYARKGIEVPLPTRTCQIFSWELLGWESPELSFRLSCSHGTYARSLAVSLGAKLDSAAVLSSLRRESVGDYSISDALALDAANSLPLSELLARFRPDFSSRPAAA